MLNLKTLATIACASIIVAGSMPQATYAKSSLVKSFKSVNSVKTIARGATTAKVLKPNTLNSLSRPKPVAAIKPPAPKPPLPKNNTVSTQKLAKPKPPVSTQNKAIIHAAAKKQNSQNVRQSLTKLSPKPNAAERGKLASSAGKLPPGKLKEEAQAAVRKIDQDTAVKIAAEKKKAIKIGGRISGYTTHGLRQKINRNVKSKDILSAVKSPLKVGSPKVDSIGRVNQRIIGNKSEVVLNPKTGKIITVNPTSSRKAKMLAKTKK